MTWDWESFLGTALGCALGWYVFPRLSRWLKLKGGLKGNPAGREENGGKEQEDGAHGNQLAEGQGDSGGKKDCPEEQVGEEIRA